MVSGPHARFSTSGSGEVLPEVLVRLAGLTVDQEFGLLPYAPIYVLAPIGAISLVRTNRTIAVSVLAIVVFYVALIVAPPINVHGWMGGWNPPARFLTPIAPLLGLFVFAGMRAVPNLLVLPVLLLQLLISGYAWQHPKILWNDGNGRAAYCEITGSRVCDRLPSLVK